MTSIVHSGGNATPPSWKDICTVGDIRAICEKADQAQQIEQKSTGSALIFKVSKTAEGLFTLSATKDNCTEPSLTRTIKISPHSVKEKKSPSTTFTLRTDTTGPTMLALQASNKNKGISVSIHNIYNPPAMRPLTPPLLDSGYGTSATSSGGTSRSGSIISDHLPIMVNEPDATQNTSLTLGKTDLSRVDKEAAVDTDAMVALRASIQPGSTYPHSGSDGSLRSRSTNLSTASTSEPDFGLNYVQTTSNHYTHLSISTDHRQPLEGQSVNSKMTKEDFLKMTEQEFCTKEKELLNEVENFHSRNSQINAKIAEKRNKINKLEESSVLILQQATSKQYEIDILEKSKNSLRLKIYDTQAAIKTLKEENLQLNVALKTVEEGLKQLEKSFQQVVDLKNACEITENLLKTIVEYKKSIEEFDSELNSKSLNSQERLSLEKLIVAAKEEIERNRNQLPKDAQGNSYLQFFTSWNPQQHFDLNTVLKDVTESLTFYTNLYEKRKQTQTEMLTNRQFYETQIELNSKQQENALDRATISFPKEITELDAQIFKLNSEQDSLQRKVHDDETELASQKEELLLIEKEYEQWNPDATRLASITTAQAEARDHKLRNDMLVSAPQLATPSLSLPWYRRIGNFFKNLFLACLPWLSRSSAVTD